MFDFRFFISYKLYSSIARQKIQMKKIALNNSGNELKVVKNTSLR